MGGQQDEKRMRLRYAGICRICEIAIPARTEAIYERTTKSVRCLSHEVALNTTAPEPQHEPAELPGVDVGIPGASARREFDRRHQAREVRVSSKHPKLGRLILALGEEPQSTTAWSTGAHGEERLGARLNELSTASLLVLHDRRIPRTRANIDHIAVTPTGIWVIDAKKYRGRRPRLKTEGGFLRQRTERLLVGSRDRTKLVDGSFKQTEAVHEALAARVQHAGIDDPSGCLPVHGVLCFVEADWPFVGGAFTIRGVDVLRPKKLYRRLQADGPLLPNSIAIIHRHLAEALPPA